MGKHFFPKRRRRQKLASCENEGIRGALQTADQFIEFGVAFQSQFKLLALGGGQRAQRVETGLFLLLLRNHAYACKLLRNFNIPRRIRALIVPSGSFNDSAISKCVFPPKKAISIASRCSDGNSFNAERIAAVSSESKVVCSWLFSNAGSCAFSNSSCKRARRCRLRNR